MAENVFNFNNHGAGTYQQGTFDAPIANYSGSAVHHDFSVRHAAVSADLDRVVATLNGSGDAERSRPVIDVIEAARGAHAAGDLPRTRALLARARDAAALIPSAVSGISVVLAAIGNG
ncbi:hypothetical protein ACFWBG_33605 [Nocardia salmonicida]|uniref:hypothetical protein n=1 Tax=Nocardia salmonicida TaxID=53431 RepID=UPI00366D1408